MRTILPLLLFASAAAWANDYSGQLYEQGSNKTKLLFKFNHHEEAQGPHKSYRNTFSDPADKPAVIEDVQFENGKLAHYALQEKQTDWTGSLDVKGNQMHFEYHKDTPCKGDEDLPDNLVIGPTAFDYIHGHWAEIMKGDSVKVRFAALERCETVGFKYFKDREIKQDGKDIVVVEMKPTSFIIAAIVKPLYFFFERDGSRCLEVDGRTLPKQLVDGKYKDLDVDFTFKY